VLEIGRGFILILPICCANPKELIFKHHFRHEVDEYLNNSIRERLSQRWWRQWEASFCRVVVNLFPLFGDDV
jgi:hypothetical protein